MNEYIRKQPNKKKRKWKYHCSYTRAKASIKRTELKKKKEKFK